MTRRSPNSHQLKLRAFPFFARLRREDPFKSADDAAWKAEADRISGGSEQWYSHAGWKEDNGFKLIGFATQDQVPLHCRDSHRSPELRSTTC